MSAHFQKFIIGGSSGEGSNGASPFFLKIVEHETAITFFFILEPLFKLSVSKPLKKQNKTK